MDFSSLPSISDVLPPPSPEAVAAAAQPTPNRSNLFASGLKSGYYGLQSNLNNAVAAGQKLLGFDAAANDSARFGTQYAQAAEAAGRPDLEAQGFTGGGVGGFLKYGAYKLAQAAPSLAGAVAGGIGAAAIAPEALATTAAARGIGAFIPGFLGGAEGEAAGAAGAKLITNSLGAGLVTVPQSVGGIYGEAVKQPGGASRSDAVKAILEGIPVGLAQTLGPAGATGVARSGLAHAATFGVGSGMQELAETQFDPSLTAGDRAQKIVQATVQGAAFGGLFGGAMGLLGGHPTVDPKSVSNDDLAKTVDIATSTTAPPAQGEFDFRQQFQNRPEGTQGSLLTEAPPFNPGRAPQLTTQDLLDRLTQGRQTAADRRETLAMFEKLAGQPEAAPVQADLPLQQRLTDLPPGSQGDLLEQPAFDAGQPPKPVTDFPTRSETLPQEPVQEPLDLRTKFEDTPEGTQTNLFEPLAPFKGRKRTSAELRAALARVNGHPTEAVAAGVDQDAQIRSTLADAGATPEQQEQIHPVEPSEIDDSAKLAAVTPEAAKARLFTQFGDDGRQIAGRGVMRDFINQSDARTPAELYNSLEDELSSGSKVSKTAGFRLVARNIGLLGDDGKLIDMDAARAAAADKPELQEHLDRIDALRQEAAGLRSGEDTPLGPSVVGTNAPQAAEHPSVVGTNAPQEPKTIADRVVDAAHDLTGGTGGEARIADLRAKLPDIAPADLENALRQIHGDDSDSTLKQAPVGQRKGVDGVSVPGQGRFHSLAVEPREDAGAVQERGATPLDVREQAGAGEGVRGGNQPAEAAPEAQSDQTGVPGARQAAEGEVAQPPPRPSISRPFARTAQAILKERNQKNVRPEATQNPETGATELPSETIGATAGDLGASLAIPAERLDSTKPDTFMPKQLFDKTPADPTAPFDSKQHFDAIVKTLSSDVKGRVHFVANYEGLPADIKAGFKSRGYNPDDIPAVYRDRQVYIRGDLVHTPAQVEEAVAHEVFGHLGSHAQLKNDQSLYIASLAKAFDNAGGVDGILKVAKKFGRSEDLKQYLRPDTATDPAEKAMFMDELIAHAAEPGALSRQKRAFLSAVGSIKQSIASTLRKGGLPNFARTFEGFGASDVAKWLDDSKRALQGVAQKSTVDLASLPGNRMRFAGDPSFDSPIAPKIRNQTESVEGTQRIVNAVFDALQRVPKLGPERFVRKGYFQIKSGQGMVRDFADQIPGMARHYELSDVRSAVGARAAQYHMPVNRAVVALSRSAPKNFRDFVDVMQSSSLHDFDPTRPIDAQTHLLDRSNFPEIQAEHARVRGLYNKFGQPSKEGNLKGGEFQRLYQKVVANSQSDLYAHNIGVLQNVVHFLDRDAQIPGFETKPVRDYAQRNDLHSNPEATRDYFKAAHDRIVDGLGQHLVRRAADLAGEADQLAKTKPQTPEEIRSTAAALDANASNSRTLEAIKAAYDGAKEAAAAQERAPYVHLGRSGDYFVSFRLKQDVDRPTADPAAIAAIQDILGRHKFNELTLNSIGTNRDVYVRLPSADQAAKLHELATGPLAEHLDTSATPLSGAIEKNFSDALLPQHYARVLEAVRQRFEGSPDAQAAAVNEARAALLDASSLTSVGRIMTRRAGVQGYDPDFIKNKVFHDQVASHSIAALSVSAEKADLAEQMLRQKRDVTQDGTRQSLKIGDAVDHYLGRDVNPRIGQSYADSIRGIAHTFYLGGSPAYAIMQLGQVGTLGLPELSKKYGFAKSMGAMAGGLKDTTLILRAMAEEAAINLRNPAGDHTPGITPKVLERAMSYGLSKEKADHIQGLANANKLELGTYARSMLPESIQRNAVRGGLSKAQQVLNGTATMSETMGRLIMGLASKRLYDAAPEKATGFASAHDYAAHNIGEAMFDWGNANTPRLFSAQGPLGRLGPLAFQFHSFGTKLFEKLWSEGSRAFKGDPEAMKFLAAHSAAIIAVSGALGLPTAGWAAAAATRLTGLFNNGESYDVDAHFRTFLSAVFGKQMGEVIAKGLPRAMGADFADLGDRNLLPFQTLLEDRRKLEDSVPHYLAQAWGSSISMGLNAALSVRDFSQGRPLEGLARGLPTPLRNLARAYQISQYGYVNSKGETMPIPTGAVDVIRQAIGIQSGAKEEEAEKGRVIQSAQDERRYHSGFIKQNIATAMERGDQAGVDRWMAEAAKYDQDPAHLGLPMSSTIGPYIAARQRAIAYSKSSGLPLGAIPKDLPAAQLVNY